jgi:hypothetical protein
MDLTIGRGRFFRQARSGILNAAQRSKPLVWHGMVGPVQFLDSSMACRFS